MNVSPITVLAPNGSAPAPRESAPSGDLFGDLLRAPASSAAPEQAPPPARTEKHPVSESKPADRPAASERNAPNGDSGAAREAEAGASDDSAPQGETGEIEAADNGQAESDANAETNTGKEAAQAPVNAAASEVAAAVLALINNTETRAPAEVGALAANTAVTAAGAAATPAVAAKPAVAAAAPELMAEEAPVDGAPPQDPGKKGLGPAQITVTDERTTLVSRPAATLAAANIQAVAEAPAEPQAQATDSNPTPKPALDAAIAPDERMGTEGQSGKDGGGKTAPVHDPALNLAAGAAKTAEVTAASGPGAEKPAPQTQTQTSTPAPAPNPAAAAPVFAAVSDLVAAPAPNVVMAPTPAATPAAANVAIDHVALQIGKAAVDGLDRITIQLKPEAMGRIDVQLQVHSDGRVHAVIAADRQDTLDLLQRDARSLERALNDAGLRADAGSLSFNLNGRGQENGTGSPDAAAPSYAGGPDTGEPQPVPAALLAAYSAAAARGGVDIRV